MFQELMPLLGQRTVIIVLSRVSDDEMRINVVPKQLKSDQQDDGAALTTPLSFTGTPKELDEHLPGQLVEFVETHLGLSSTLKHAKEQMEAAGKAAREAAKKSTKKSTNSKLHGGSSNNATASAAQVQTEASAKESSHDSQSSPAPTPETSVDTKSGGLVASTGTLFDIELKNDN